MDFKSVCMHGELFLDEQEEDGVSQIKQETNESTSNWITFPLDDVESSVQSEWVLPNWD